MESDSRFSYGGEPSSSRMDRSMDQFMTIPQHSTLSQPRMTTLGDRVNPLDLTSAIQHELRRSNNQPGWAPWNVSSSALSHASSLDVDSGFSISSYGSFLSSHQHSDDLGSHHLQQNIIPQYIPRFDEAMPAPALHLIGHQIGQPRTHFAPETEFLGSARHGFYSRSADELPPPGSLPAQQVTARVDSMGSCSPWIERMMQADVTPTPSAVNICLSTSLSLDQRTALDVSCVASQTVDLQSSYSSDMPQRSNQSMRSAFSSDPQLESTVELSADLCTDDDDLETRPMDVKRKKRMLSNRASAQRSRQRRQERLDQLEVLTAKLRVENSTLQKKLSAAIQVAKKFDDQNKDLLKKVDRLSKELELGCGKRARKPTAANFINDTASSQQTACASSCEMVGERPSVDPNVMRDGNNANDGASTLSMSPNSERETTDVVSNNGNNNNNNNNNNGASLVSPLRKCFSACRMEKKRSHDESEGTTTAAAAGLGASSSYNPTGANHMVGGSSDGNFTASSSQPRPASPSSEPRPLWHEVCHPLGDADCLEADRWLEFTECFL